MAKQLINIGPVTKDSLKTGATKINANFNELYANLGNGTDLQFAVDLTATPLSGQTLQYNTTSGKFVAATVSSGAAASNSFASIAVSGQSNVVADSSTDTLTLVAGPNITITTNATSDSVTISAASGGSSSGVSTGTVNRLAYYAATGAVIQDSGAELTWNGTNLNITGTITATGDVSYVRAYFDTLAGLQAVSASTWHGMVAHVHENGGRMYYAHGGVWKPMSNFSDLNIFKTIAVAGQTSVEADNDADTLTFVAGTNVSITTNATTDTITINATGSAASNLDSLTDVVITSVANGQVLKYNGSNWINAADATSGGAGNLDSLTDVVITGTPATGQVLKYNGTNWINDTDAVSAGTGGGTVTSVSGTGTVNGLTLSGTVTSTGNLTLGGTLGSIGNAQLSNSTISNVALGGNLFALTAGTGVSFNTGTTYNGSAAITINATSGGSTSIDFVITADIYSSYYIFSGPGIVSGNTNDPALYLYRGFTYTFNNTTGGSHPFAIQTSVGGNYTGGGLSGSTTGTQTFTVPMNLATGATLRYICTIHSQMMGTINIV